MSAERDAETYPKLTDREIELFRTVSHERAVHAGEILFEQGEPTTKLFVVLEGELEIVNPRKADGNVIITYERGSFSGEMTMLGGGHALAQCRARTAGRVLEVESHPTAQSLLDQFGVTVDDVPVVIMLGKRMLKNPTNEQLADCLGYTP